MSSKALHTHVDDRSEQRTHARHQVETVMPAQLIDGPTERRLPCRIFDVSDDGLCVVAGEELAVGATLVFVTLKQRFTFTVAWCRAEGAKEFRVGLRLTGEETNLKSVFSGYLGSSLGPRRIRPARRDP